MLKRMNDGARRERWQQQAALFIGQVWSPFNRGFGFLATRTAGGKRWREHVVPIGTSVAWLLSEIDDWLAARAAEREHTHYADF